MKTTQPTAAAYLRVSTDKQTTDNQRGAVLALAKAGGFAVPREHLYVETISGAADERARFNAMREAVRSRKVSAVTVWAIDRLGRNMERIVSTIREFDAYGVSLRSVQEPWLDTGGPARELLISIFAWVAQYERTRLRERTREGVARKRKEMKGKWGRAKGTKDRKPRVRRWFRKPPGVA